MLLMMIKCVLQHPEQIYGKNFVTLLHLLLQIGRLQLFLILSSLINFDILLPASVAENCILTTPPHRSLMVLRELTPISALETVGRVHSSLNTRDDEFLCILICSLAGWLY